MNVILYSTHCPKCKTLKMLLDKKGVSYIENNSIEEMLSLGFSKAPILSVDGENMDFSKARKWLVENYKGEC